MPFFREAGRSLHYLERGQGETVLLIHGLGGSGTCLCSLAIGGCSGGVCEVVCGCLHCCLRGGIWGTRSCCCKTCSSVR